MPDDSFKEFVLDQLGALPELRARAKETLKVNSLLRFYFAGTGNFLSIATRICDAVPPDEFNVPAKIPEA